jgi:hypothetical protein
MAERGLRKKGSGAGRPRTRHPCGVFHAGKQNSGRANDRGRSGPALELTAVTFALRFR